MSSALVPACTRSNRCARQGHERASHWERLASGEQIDWREAFEGWGSTVDWLGARFYREMLGGLAARPR